MRCCVGCELCTVQRATWTAETSTVVCSPAMLGVNPAFKCSTSALMHVRDTRALCGEGVKSEDDYPCTREQVMNGSYLWYRSDVGK